MYEIVFLCLFTLSFLEQAKFIKHQHWGLYVVAWIILSMISGTRLCVGQDWLGYLNLYNAQTLDLENIFDLNNSAEIGFRLLALGIKICFNSFEIFLLVISLMTSFFISVSFIRLSPMNAYTLTFLYYSIAYFHQQFGIIRNGLAVAIFLYAISYSLSNKRYAVLGIFNYFIHKSSIFFTILYKLSELKIKKSTEYALCSALIIVGIFNVEVLYLVTYFMTSFSMDYSGYFYEGSQYTENIGITNTSLMVLIFFSYNVFISKKEQPFSRMVFIYLIINIAFPYAFISRINSYFLALIWIYMLSTINSSKYYLKIFFMILIFSYALIGFSHILFNEEVKIFRNYDSWIINYGSSFEQCGELSLD
jgi:hypothetical protein